MKGEKRAAMYAMPRDRKVYLLRQNRHFKTANQRSANASSATYGPSSGVGLLPRIVPQLTGDAGLLKRISIIGWGSGPTLSQKSSQDPTGSSHNLSKSPPNSPRRSEESQVIRPQTTGGTWASWWASTSASSPDARRGGESMSAKWYIDCLKMSKVVDIKLVKHLIALRVQLSTAQLAFIEDFVGPQKGLDALGQLLAGLVGKGGKKKSLGEVENTVLLETVKCLQVLLNTEVSLVTFCLYILTFDALRLDSVKYPDRLL